MALDSFAARMWPERSKGQFIGKVRAVNESYARKWTLLLLSLIFVSLLQLNRMHFKKQWLQLYIYVCMQSEIQTFRTLVVRCKHT